MLPNKKISIVTVFFNILAISCLAIPSVLAVDFNPNFIISDEDLLDPGSMSQATIQKFLQEKGGALVDHTCISEGKDQNGNQIASQFLTGAQAIYEVAQRWGVSPKFLLVLLQKEQSLVTDPAPTEKDYNWATGYGVCDGCSLDDPAIQRWKGFYKQINSAAAQYDYYMDHPSEFPYQAGKSYRIDNTIVVPTNQATAAMYNYTPHIHGNKNFFNLWTQWFLRIYPDGSLVQVKGQPAVWYLQGGTKRPIKSKIALVTRFSEKQIITISQSDLDAYSTGWPINLANYSLVKNSQGQIYLIVDDTRRLITSLKVFKKIGWNPEEVDLVADADLDSFWEGDPITEDSVYPQGALAQDKTTGGVYFVKDGTKYPIMSKEIMKVNYPGKNIIKLTSAELDKYPTGDPIKLKDGTIVKSTDSPAVYVVSNGMLRVIPDEKAFTSLGYKWSNLITTSAKALGIHPLGDILTP